MRTVEGEGRGREGEGEFEGERGRGRGRAGRQANTTQTKIDMVCIQKDNKELLTVS